MNSEWLIALYSFNSIQNSPFTIELPLVPSPQAPAPGPRLPPTTTDLVSGSNTVS